MRFLLNIAGRWHQAAEQHGAKPVMLPYRLGPPELYHWRDFETLADLGAFVKAINREGLVLLYADGRKVADHYLGGIAEWPAELCDETLMGLSVQEYYD